MRGSDYVCGTCGYRFRTPAEAPRDARSLMCPGCGSIDVNIVTAPAVVSRVMRAKVPATSVEREPEGSGVV